jgi:hypothetical protein
MSRRRVMFTPSTVTPTWDPGRLSYRSARGSQKGFCLCMEDADCRPEYVAVKKWPDEIHTGCRCPRKLEGDVPGVRFHGSRMTDRPLGGQSASTVPEFFPPQQLHIYSDIITSPSLASSSHQTIALCLSIPETSRTHTRTIHARRTRSESQWYVFTGHKEHDWTGLAAP